MDPESWKKLSGSIVIHLRHRLFYLHESNSYQQCNQTEKTSS